MADTTTNFSPDDLRERYKAERDKRIRIEGNAQYTEVAGRFAHYVDDPYVEPGYSREPLTDEVDVIAIGGGFGGLISGARLKSAGVESLRIVEKGGDFGGTWYWNRYPGAMCDVESYIYLPLLEETGYIPSEKYVKAAEILEHCKLVANTFGLYDNACFQTEVTRVEWDDTDNRWIVHTNRGDAMRARFVLMASGPLHRPKLPGIEGIESFAGHSFHTSRWDYDYTGGGPLGGLDRLGGKRVGIIGTGATSVQCVPHLAETADQLFVFQRTPSSIDVRDNQPTDPEWAASLEPGWHRERMENFNTLVSGGFAAEDLVDDGWTDIIVKLLNRATAGEADLTPEGIEAAYEMADFEKMEQIRARVDELIDDPATAEALKPWYRQFCKRPCFHDDYLQTFNRPNVDLVDTDGQGVDRLTPEGVVVGDTTYEIDCLIYATGFEVGTGFTRRSGCEFVGTDGQTLTDYWADGVRTMHGMFARGFPNLFIMSHMQGGFTVNYPHMLDELSTHVAYVLSHVFENDIERVEVAAAAEQAWVDEIIAKARNVQEFRESCTPGYYNNEGQPAATAAQNTAYGLGNIAFFAKLAEWRDAGDFEGLELS